MNFILKPLNLDELKKFFNVNSIKILNYFIKKSIFSQPERRIWQKKLPIQIPKEHIEQWLVQSLGTEGIGAWNYAIDIINEKGKWGADVKMLSAKIDKEWNLKNNDSWETSLAQKFIETGKNLDDLFNTWKFEIIKSEWLWIYKNKLNKVIYKHNLKNIYYFVLLRGGEKLYILWMEVLLKNLENAKVNEKRTSKDSVFIDNFIDGKYWYIKIYKAKKRLELRLKPKNWFDDNLCIEFLLELDWEEINFIDYIEEWWDMIDYWKKKVNKIFNINILKNI